jgi:hypothetical protein
VVSPAGGPLQHQEWMREAHMPADIRSAAADVATVLRLCRQWFIDHELPVTPDAVVAMAALVVQRANPRS